MVNAMLDVIQQVAGAYGPDMPVARKIAEGHVPDEQLDAIPELWAQQAKPPVPVPESEQYRPYLPDPYRSRAVAQLSRTPILDFDSPHELVADSSALIHHLLYADAMAISDPIPGIFDEGSFGVGSVEEVLQYRRNRLTGLTLFLAELDPVIDPGILTFIDAPDYPVSYTARDLRNLAHIRDIRKVVDDLDPFGKELFRQAGERRLGLVPGTMPPFQPESYASVALNGILAGLTAGDADHGAWDLYLPHPAMEPVLGYLAGPSRSMDRGKRRKLLRNLISIELPNITDHITPHDLAVIRRDEGVFAAWRHDLKAALRALDDELDQDPELPSEKRLAIVRDDLAGVAARVNSGIGKSAALTLLKAAGITFTIGGIVELAAGHSEAALTTVPIAAALGLLYEYLSGRRERVTGQALARHHAVFREPPTR
ncbi:hypothetical protein GFY24_36115 [Nocardia sp. SYP-A9097]|uniref:hypothetical protein n=1 Tax=Nocardia sp. SYP-A9097 TaxID=2663237 RepID=UPI00129B749C|nr:hypothetical protein [Nocardia sp. SYP-A9097]MRH92784.1 hypothetical protein [Nocardia sp. SYP-A9097]